MPSRSIFHELKPGLRPLLAASSDSFSCLSLPSDSFSLSSILALPPVALPLNSFSSQCRAVLFHLLQTRAWLVPITSCESGRAVFFSPLDLPFLPLRHVWMTDFSARASSGARGPGNPACSSLVPNGSPSPYCALLRAPPGQNPDFDPERKKSCDFSPPSAVEEHPMHHDITLFLPFHTLLETKFLPFHTLFETKFLPFHTPKNCTWETEKWSTAAAAAAATTTLSSP